MNANAIPVHVESVTEGDVLFVLFFHDVMSLKKCHATAQEQHHTDLLTSTDNWQYHRALFKQLENCGVSQNNLHLLRPVFTPHLRGLHKT